MKVMNRMKKWNNIRTWITMISMGVILCTTSVQAVGIHVEETKPVEESTKPPDAGTEQPPAAGTEQSPDAGTEQPPAVGTEQPPAVGTEQPPAAGTEQPAAATKQPPAGQVLQSVAAPKLPTAVVPVLPKASVTLDISKGSIVIDSGGYTQENVQLDPALNPTGVYTIMGTSEIYSVDIVGGTPEVTLTDFGIDLKAEQGRPALHIADGAVLTLIVSNTKADASTLLRGGNAAAGIQVDAAGKLILQGTGKLLAIGGSGAVGIGGDMANPSGGSLEVTSPKLQLEAYSDTPDHAVMMKPIQTGSKLLKGSLDAGTVQSTKQNVMVKNRNDDTEYPLELPESYASFATTTTPTGGEYISYLPADVGAGKLLTTAEGTSVYNLEGTNKTASMLGLRSQLVEYNVVFNANGGRFPQENNAATVLKRVPYGSTVTLPSNPEKDANNTVNGWYTNIEGTSAVWDFANSVVVKDTTLFVKWKPAKCHVTYISNIKEKDPVKKTYDYDQKLNRKDVENMEINGDMVLSGWYTNTVPSKAWDFANDTIQKEDLVLTASWLEQFDITFNPNTTDAVTNMPDATKITQGNTLAKPTKEPKRTDYRFENWYSDRACTKLWDFANQKVMGKTVLYAGWAVEHCTVQFESGDGATKVKEQSIAYNTKITQPTGVTKAERPEPNPTTYSVEGWYTDKGLTKKWDFDQLLISKSPTFLLYAKWHQDTCYITFDAATGVPADNQTKSVAYGQPVQAAELTRTGYRLNGWNNGNARWDFTSAITSDMILKAQWVKESYALSFDTKGGTPSITPQTILYEGKGRKPKDPVKPGYVFAGWYSTDTYETSSAWDFTKTTMPGHPVTLFARWMPIIYQAVYHANEGVPAPAPEAGLQYDSILTQPAEMTREHFTFEGWYLDEATTKTKWDFTKPVSEAGTALTEDLTTDPAVGTLTLYAKWVPMTYTVTFSTGADEPALESKDQTQKIVYQNTVKAPRYPAEPWLGHTFRGWYTDPNFTDESLWGFEGDAHPQTVESDITLYARWQLNDYYISYDHGDGNGPIKQETIYHYGNYIADAPVLAKEHYSFVNWYKDSACSEDQVWTLTKDTIVGDTTLYAKWVGDPHVLQIHVLFEEGNAEHATPVVVKSDVHYGDKPTLQEIEKQVAEAVKPRLGYTLDAWYKDDIKTTKWDFTTGMIEADTDLYAQWSRDEYKLTFQTYEGDPAPIPPQTCWYEAKVTRPQQDPVRPHYSFDGWYKEAAYETKWNFEKDFVYGDTTLYAKWIPDIYKLSFETNEGSKLETIKVEYGTLVPLEALNTQRKGYAVSGWYRDEARTVPFDPYKDLVDANMTIYAAWVLEDYTVTYQMAKKDGSEITMEVDSKIYHYKDKIAKPTFQKPHQTLNGWYQDPEYKEKWVFKRDTVQGNTTIYAYWTDTEYTIKYDTADGTAIKDQKLNWGAQLDKPANPVRDGHTFIDWFKDSSTKTPWSFEDDFIEGDTTLYAGWSINNYTIRFNADGGAPEPEPVVVPYGALIPKPEDPAKEGYTFEGWQSAGTKKAAIPVWNFASDKVKGDTTLTATWKQDEAPVVDPTNPDKKDPTDPNKKDPTTTTTTDTAKKGTSTTNTTKTPTETTAKNPVSAAGEEIKKAAQEVAKILTGDKAPIAFALAGLMVSGVLLLAWFIRKMKSKK